MSKRLVMIFNHELDTMFQEIERRLLNNSVNNKTVSVHFLDDFLEKEREGEVVVIRRLKKPHHPNPNFLYNMVSYNSEEELKKRFTEVLEGKPLTFDKKKKLVTKTILKIIEMVDVEDNRIDSISPGRRVNILLSSRTGKEFISAVCNDPILMPGGKNLPINIRRKVTEISDFSIFTDEVFAEIDAILTSRKQTGRATPTAYFGVGVEEDEEDCFS